VLIAVVYPRTASTAVRLNVCKRGAVSRDLLPLKGAHVGQPLSQAPSVVAFSLRPPLVKAATSAFSRARSASPTRLCTMTYATSVEAPPRLPAVWGHRGVSCLRYTDAISEVWGQASAQYPENTLISFKQAILDGAEGIESGASSEPRSEPTLSLLPAPRSSSRPPRLLPDPPALRSGWA
jgi:hypothetical protein